MEDQKTSPLQLLSPKQIFLFGAGAGFLVLCTVGFFILLFLVFRGNVTLASGSVGATPPPPPAVIDPGADVPTQITVRPVDAKNDHIRGAKDAKVTIIEYSDFECPFCKRHHETMLKVVEANKQNVRWVYRHFPLDGLHQQARKEALASECAAEQGKFWEFADLIFQETTSNDGLDLAKLPEYARRVGIDVNKFNTCLSSEKYAAAVQEDERDAQAAGARGTPYSVLIGPNGETVPLSGALPQSQIQSAITAALGT